MHTFGPVKPRRQGYNHVAFKATRDLPTSGTPVRVLDVDGKWTKGRAILPVLDSSLPLTLTLTLTLASQTQSHCVLAWLKRTTAIFQWDGKNSQQASVMTHICVRPHTWPLYFDSRCHKHNKQNWNKPSDSPCTHYYSIPMFACLQGE